MGNFAKTHSLPTFEERKKAKLEDGNGSYKKWLNVDEIVSDIYVDLANGYTDSDVLEKLTKGLYEGQKKPLGIRTAYDYLAAARDRMHYDFEAQCKVLREDLYNKLISVYADAVQNNDRYNALIAVDKIMKLTGVGQPQQQNNIQVNANKEGIKISFGFNKDEDEETNES